MGLGHFDPFDIAFGERRRASVRNDDRRAGLAEVHARVQRRQQRLAPAEPFGERLLSGVEYKGPPGSAPPA